MNLYFDPREKEYYTDIKKALEALNPADQYSYCLQLKNDNAALISFTSALIMDPDTPFLTEEARKQYIKFKNIQRPEIEGIIATLVALETERQELHLEFSQIDNSRIARIREVINYIIPNYEDLLFKMPRTLKINADINYAINQAIKDKNFHFSDPSNKVRRFWDRKLAETRQKFVVQDLNKI